MPHHRYRDALILVLSVFTIAAAATRASGLWKKSAAQTPPASSSVLNRDAGTLWSSDLERARESLARQKQREYRDALVRLHRDFPNNAHALHDLALAEASLGNDAAALGWLKRYVAAGLIPRLNDPSFARLQRSGRLSHVSRAADRNSRVLSTSTVVFGLDDADLLVEDIAYDPETQRIFLSSIRKRKILSCDMSGRCRDFFPTKGVNPEQVWAVAALRVDSRARILWATTAGMKQEERFQQTDEGRSSVLKLNLDTGALLQRFDAPPDGKHLLGDMVVSSRGDIYVSDDSGDIFRLRRDGRQLERLTKRNAFISPQTPALSADERTLYVPDYAAGIAAVDVANGSVYWLSPTIPAALEGIDGMYRVGRDLLAVQNGTRPRRIVTFRLGGRFQITGWRVLESNGEWLGEPTHATIAGNSAYFIANSGWDRIEEDGSMKPGTAAQVRRLCVPSRCK